MAESTRIQGADLDPNCGFAKEESVQAILNAVQNGGGAVKSVQRGKATCQSGATTPISINTINPNKAFVILEFAYDSWGVETRCWVESLTENTLTIGLSEDDDTGGDFYVTYQIVEYY